MMIESPVSDFVCPFIPSVHHLNNQVHKKLIG